MFDQAPHAQNSKTLRRRVAGLLVAAGLVALAGPPLAADEPRWTARVQAAGIFTGSDQVRVTRPTGEETVQSVSDGGGFQLSLARRFGRRYSVELAYFLGEFDSDFQIIEGGLPRSSRDQFINEIYSVGVNYHLTPNRRADVSLGLIAAMGVFDDVVFFRQGGSPEKLSFDDDTGFGLKLAVDVPLRRDGRWLLSAEARVLSMILESEVAGQDLELNPWMLAVGIGYRF